MTSYIPPAYGLAFNTRTWRTHSNNAAYKYEHIHGLVRCLNRKGTCQVSVIMGVETQMGGCGGQITEDRDRDTRAG